MSFYKMPDILILSFLMFTMFLALINNSINFLKKQIEISNNCWYLCTYLFDWLLFSTFGSAPEWCLRLCDPPNWNSGWSAIGVTLNLAHARWWKLYNKYWKIIYISSWNVKMRSKSIVYMQVLSNLNTFHTNLVD